MNAARLVALAIFLFALEAWGFVPVRYHLVYDVPDASEQDARDTGDAVCNSISVPSVCDDPPFLLSYANLSCASLDEDPALQTTDYLGVRLWPSRMLVMPTLAAVRRQIVALNLTEVFCACASRDLISGIDGPFTVGPTSAPTFSPLRSADADALLAFRAASGLDAAGYCGNATDGRHPCEACVNSPGYPEYHRILCEDDGFGESMITEIVLMNAGLEDIPQVELSAFQDLTLLRIYDLSTLSPPVIDQDELLETPNLIANASQTCFEIPRCRQGGVSCLLPLPICDGPDTGGAIAVPQDVAQYAYIGVGTLFAVALMLYCMCIYFPKCARRWIDLKDDLHRRRSIVLKRLSSVSGPDPDWEAIRSRFVRPAAPRPPPVSYEVVASSEPMFETVFDARRGTHEMGPLVQKSHDGVRRRQPIAYEERRVVTFAQDVPEDI